MTGKSKSRGKTTVFFQDADGTKGSISEEGIMPITKDEAAGLIADSSTTPAKGNDTMTTKHTTTNNPGRRASDAAPVAAKPGAKAPASADKAVKDAQIAAKAKADAAAKVKAEREAAQAAKAQEREQARAKREADAKAKADADAKAKADVKAKREADLKAKAAAKAAAKAEREASRKVFVPGPATGVTRIKDTTVDLSHYVKHEATTPSGRHVIDNNDEVAAKLRGMALDNVYTYVAAALKVAETALRAQYGHLNPGMQRMNLGNRIRGAAVSAEAAKRREEKKAERALVIAEARTKRDEERKLKSEAAKVARDKAAAEKKEAKAKAAQEAATKRQAETKAKADAAEKAKIEAKGKADAAKAKRDEEAKAKADAAAKAASAKVAKTGGAKPEAKPAKTATKK